jgi:hypothetical protein
MICLLLLLGACSREVNIKDAPESGVGVGRGTDRDAGEIPIVLDAGLDSSLFAPCAERSNGRCAGPNDFLCNFDDYVVTIVNECQVATGCGANGLVAVELGDDGCASAIRMTEPHSPFLGCLVEELGSVRCPCDAEYTEVFLGVASSGCADAATAD